MIVTRVAVVTGGGSGIGAAACRELARRGNRVAVLDIDGEAARQVAYDLKTLGSEAIGLEADVTDREAVEVAFVEYAPISDRSPFWSPAREKSLSEGSRPSPANPGPRCSTST